MPPVLRYFDHSAGSYFLFGPRGTGKSTWLRERYPDAAWIDLLDTSIQRVYLARPERLVDFISANRDRKVIVIDDVQRAPQLLSLVHQQIEKDKSLQFVLTGSSARKIKQAGVDLLGGRALLRNMHPFMASELGASFDLDQCLTLGMLPLVCMSATPQATLKGYIDLYIQQEIQAEGLVRKLDVFVRFLEAISFSHANLLNSASVARECGASRNTVDSYVTILEDLLLAARVPVFKRRAKRAMVSHSKLFFFDSGVYRSVRPVGPLDAPQEMAGPTLEGLVFQHLRAWIEYRQANLKLHFWRTLAGSEVDFVLYGNDGLFALEVKNSRTIRPEDIRPLRTFVEDYPEAKVAFLYMGNETINRHGIRCMPVDQFLRALRPDQQLPI